VYSVGTELALSLAREVSRESLTNRGKSKGQGQAGLGPNAFQLVLFTMRWLRKRRCLTSVIEGTWEI
jgi:hypothetical protein